ncbi:MAG: chemotaxis protein CheW [Oligoflexia bacterium]|nr:chemotaxis protein CheW [Oligoflexia bacterium]MBF0366761.1 chemotaxis protein CheW [Oligoflexia bacterium]
MKNDLQMQVALGREELNKNGAKKNKYLIFDLAEEKYGIPLFSVKEVIGLVSIVSVPHVPPFFKGIINLRGKIISVIDLRLKLSLPSGQYLPKKTCIIITEIDGFTLGVVVDDVIEVANYDTAQIENNLDIQSKIAKEFITGVAKKDKGLTLLLNIGQTLNIDELKLLKEQPTSAS